MSNVWLGYPEVTMFHVAPARNFLRERYGVANPERAKERTRQLLNRKRDRDRAQQEADGLIRLRGLMDKLGGDWDKPVLSYRDVEGDYFYVEDTPANFEHVQGLFLYGSRILARERERIHRERGC